MKNGGEGVSDPKRWRDPELATKPWVPIQRRRQQTGRRRADNRSREGRGAEIRGLGENSKTRRG